MTTFIERLKTHYETHAEATAIYLQHAQAEDFAVSYAHLLQRAAATADALANAGIQPGEVVILILQHGEDLIYAYFGVLLHGAIPSIMPFLTEKLSPERYRADLTSLVEVTRPSAIITYPEFEAEVRSATASSDAVRSILLSSALQHSSQPVFDLQCRQADDIVLLQHSSGTTGLQKGVALSHQAVFNQIDAYSQALHLNAQDVIVSWLPLYHDMGLIAGFLMPILTATPLVLMSPFDWVRAPWRLMQAVSKYRGTLVWLPNFAYNFCAQKTRDRHMEGVDLSSWRAVINCSEPMRHESQQEFLQRFAPFGFKESALAVSYAMAENTFAVTQGGIDDGITLDVVDREALQVERIAKPAINNQPQLVMVSAGKPINNTQVKVVDEKGNTLPDRHIGELAVHSNCMLSGYYHRTDATEQVFIGNWYLTGDYGYMVAGDVYITGRKKDLIIVGGKNVYPQDLERLAMTVPGIHPGRVVAFGIYNEAAGTEEVVIVAEVDTDDEAEKARIANEVRQVVTTGSAVALRHVHLVAAKWILKTSSGKTARLANREKYIKAMENA